MYYAWRAIYILEGVGQQLWNQVVYISEYWLLIERISQHEAFCDTNFITALSTMEDYKFVIICIWADLFYKDSIDFYSKA